MSFELWLKTAWSEHAFNARGVAERMPQAIELLETPQQTLSLVGFANHLFGEHLAFWGEGMQYFMDLQKLDLAKNDDVQNAIARASCSLKIASHEEPEAIFEELLSEFNASDRTIILGTATSALAAHGKTANASQMLLTAARLAKDLPAKDPAHRALAISSNNLASSFEEKSTRSKEENELMLQAARVARQSWEEAGTWLEVERAEYRLAMSYLKADRVTEANQHAKFCLEICLKNEAESVERFFAYEAMALVSRAAQAVDQHRVAYEAAKKEFAQLSVDDQNWCKQSLEKIAP